MKSREQRPTQDKSLLWSQQQGRRSWRSKHSGPQEEVEVVVLRSCQRAQWLRAATHADQGCPEWTELSPAPPPHLQMKNRGSPVLTGGFWCSSEELMA